MYPYSLGGNNALVHIEGGALLSGRELRAAQARLERWRINPDEFLFR